MPQDIETRLAKLEERVANKIQDDKDYKEGIQESLKDIHEKLSEIQQLNMKQKGFIGGAVFVVGGVAAIASMLFNKFF